MANEPVKFRVTLTDKSGAWFGGQVGKMNKALNSMGASILNLSRMKAPRKTGAMRDEARVIQGNKKVIIAYPSPYSGYQERGKRADGSHVVRHYTTPNTGAHYLETTGKDVVKRGIKWFLSHS